MMKKLIRITTIPLSLEKLLGKQLTFMNAYFDVTAVSSDEKKLQEVAHDLKVKHHHIEMTREITPIKDLKAIYALYRFLKKEKPEIVHTHTPKAGLVGMMAAYMAGVPNRLHTVAGLPLMEAKGFKRFVLNNVERLTYLCAHKVYPNSKGLKDFIIKEKLANPKKLKVIANGSSNGIDTHHFDKKNISISDQKQLKSKLGVQDDDFVFIFVGRLVKDKGINELVAAFSNISSQNSTTKLLLVGPMEAELDPLAPQTLIDIENNPNIISVGFQKDVRPYFAIADTLVFPSYREGFPNVVMQAGSMGLPSIVTNINGCNEIVDDGQNGLIIPVKDENAVENAMQKILEDSTLQEKLQKNARPMIVYRYQQEVVWDALLKEYQSV